MPSEKQIINWIDNEVKRAEEKVSEFYRELSVAPEYKKPNLNYNIQYQSGRQDSLEEFKAYLADASKPPVAKVETPPVVTE